VSGKLDQFLPRNGTAGFAGGSGAAEMVGNALVQKKALT
jgi:hypothetical protein